MAAKIARCSRGKCRRRPRPDGRYCAFCHAAANRRSHRKHRKERNARRRDRSQTHDETTRALNGARAKLYVAIARGKIVKGACVVCHRHDKVVAHIANPARWHDVVWTCREHRDEVRTGGQTRADAPPIHGERWLDQREAVLSAITELSEEERERLYDVAARGPAGTRLRPESPLFAMRLVRAYQIRASALAESNGGS